MKTVYILTNESMPGIIKIGWTDNSVEQRMKELDKTSTPLPFTCYYAKRVKDPTFVESKMHQAFDEFRIRDNREFFRMSPEQAKAALEIADGDDVTPKDDVVENESDRAALNKERNRNRFNFSQIGINFFGNDPVSAGFGLFENGIERSRVIHRQISKDLPIDLDACCVEALHKSGIG